MNVEITRVFQFILIHEGKFFAVCLIGNLVDYGEAVVTQKLLYKLDRAL